MINIKKLFVKQYYPVLRQAVLVIELDKIKYDDLKKSLRIQDIRQQIMDAN